MRACESICRQRRDRAEIAPRSRRGLTAHGTHVAQEYKTVLNGVRSAGFHPHYVAKQQSATYLKVQEGSTSLYSAYEASFGNVV